jgi:SAM-dependent methyltransferase
MTVPHSTHQTLKDLAIKYSCDKYYAHSYIGSGFYESLFDSLVKPVRKFLEIGIGYEELMTPLVPKYIHGASLRMWEEYFPGADIFACDIRPDTLINEGRIHSTVCDQYDSRALRSMASEFSLYGFDVVLDDGCHHVLGQVISFMALWPIVRPGGIYIIEDVGYPEQLSKAIEGDVHIFRKNGRWDDVLVTKRKDF